jgi:hypothetical protein
MNIDDVINAVGGTGDAPVAPMGQPQTQQPPQVGQNGIVFPDANGNYPKPQKDTEKQNMVSYNTKVRQDDFNNTFDSALYNISEGGAGLGSVMKDIPLIGAQTSAGNLEADLSKITSTATLDEMTRRRNESPTGALMGSMSDGDRKVLTDAQVAIRQAMEKKELAYRVMMFQDLSNNVINGQGQYEEKGGVPGKTRLPSPSDIQRAQTLEELEAMDKAFTNYPVFEGQPPQMIDKLLITRYNQIRGGQ